MTTRDAAGFRIWAHATCIDGIAGIEAAREALPDVPHVAIFDTAFFASLPPEAYTYARFMRMGDGPDQVHLAALGKVLVKRHGSAAQPQTADAAPRARSDEALMRW